MHLKGLADKYTSRVLKIALLYRTSMLIAKNVYEPVLKIIKVVEKVVFDFENFLYLLI